MAGSLEVGLEFVLNEGSYHSKMLVEMGRKHFHEIGK